MGTYGNFVRGNLWELMGTLCGVTPCVRENLCELMGTYENFVRGNLWELMELCAE